MEVQPFHRFPHFTSYSLIFSTRGHFLLCTTRRMGMRQRRKLPSAFLDPDAAYCRANGPYRSFSRPAPSSTQTPPPDQISGVPSKAAVTISALSLDLTSRRFPKVTFGAAPSHIPSIAAAKFSKPLQALPPRLTTIRSPLSLPGSPSALQPSNGVSRIWLRTRNQ